MDWIIASGMYVSVIFNIVFEIIKFIAVILFIKVCITYLNKNKWKQKIIERYVLQILCRISNIVRNKDYLYFVIKGGVYYRYKKENPLECSSILCNCRNINVYSICKFSTSDGDYKTPRWCDYIWQHTGPYNIWSTVSGNSFDWRAGVLPKHDTQGNIFLCIDCSSIWSNLDIYTVGV